MSKAQTIKKVTKLTKEEAEKASAIMLAIEIESAFKLYSYRITGHEQFIQRTKDLVSLFQSNIKNGK